MPFSFQQIYRRVRPVLYRLGVLNMARRLLSRDVRQKIASRVGLAGFDVVGSGSYVLPRREPQQQITLNGVNFIGDVEAPIGTGVAARQLIKALDSAGIATNVINVPLFSPRGTPPAQQNAPPPDSDLYNITILHVNPPEVPAALEQISEHMVNECYLIAYWHWELSTFPEKWHKILHYFDEIWVASEFVREALQQYTTSPVTRIPLPVQVMPSGRNPFPGIIPEGRFVFLTTFAPSSNVARKNPFGVIHAYERAFGNQPDRPLLVIKTHQLDSIYGEKLAAPLREAVQNVGGVLIEEQIDRQQMMDLLATCDCLVSLHRSEGFGLPIAEAMAMGKPVICTAYAGSVDFATETNSYPVNYHLRAISADDHVYFPPMAQIYEIGSMWAEPDLEHAAQLMRVVFTDREQATRRGERAQHDIHAALSHGRVGEHMKARLEAVGK